MPVKHSPIIDEIKTYLNTLGFRVDSYNAHLHKKFMYVTFLVYNESTRMQSTVIGKVNSDNSYKLYVEMD